jgi:hypothetical protein
LGHASWTTRKTDPDWVVGLPNDGPKAIIDIQNQIAKELEEPMPTYRTVLNVPDADWARDVTDWAIDEAKTWKITDAVPDDWDKNLTDGRFQVFLMRYHNSLGNTPGPKGDTGETGDTGATGAKGDPGTVEPGTVLDLSTTATVTAVS